MGYCAIWVSTTTQKANWVAAWVLQISSRHLGRVPNRSHVDGQKLWDWPSCPSIIDPRLRRPTLRPSAEEVLCYAHNLHHRRYRGLFRRRYRGLVRRPLTEVAPQVLSVRSRRQRSLHKLLFRRRYRGVLRRRYRGLLRRPDTEVAPKAFP